MKLSDLPDIKFVDTDRATVEKEIFELYQSCTGRTLSKGDPIRLFLLCVTEIVLLLLNSINETGKQNLLRYAKGDNLDHIGVLVGADRLQPVAAKTTLRIELSAARTVNTLVPAGTRVKAASGDEIYFALTDPAIITAGQLTVDAAAECTVTGIIGNGYAPGEIDTIMDPVPYVKAMKNITISAGGADLQSDDSYREVIHEAPEAFSVAGPDGAYIYLAKAASSLISDVAVFSPSPGVVQVTPLLAGGKIPEDEVLQIVEDALSPKDKRPLTDQVNVKAPIAVAYTVDVEYYISGDNRDKASAIQAAVENAVDEYLLWQKQKLGRDINPSELIARIVAAGAKRVIVTAPVFTTLTATQVAQEGTVNVKLGGIEDE